MDIAGIKSNFPLLTDPKNKNLAYLDNAAMTQKPEQVLQAMDEYYREYCANAHRGIYPMAERVTEEFEGARAKVAKFIGARSSNVIFTRNTTEGINLLARGVPEKSLNGGKFVVVVTEMEHHSNLIPWQKLVEARNGELRFIPVDKNGELDLSNLDEIVAGASIVSVVWVSNVLGTVNPVRKIIVQARKLGAKGVRIFIDGAQALPHFRVNVDSLGADALVFSSYKLGGPTGVGVLWASDTLLGELEPLHYGGHMVSDVEFRGATFKDSPWKYEAGTQDIAGVIGLGAAIDFLSAQDWGALEDHEKNLAEYLYSELSKIDGVYIFGSPSKSDSIALASFNINGVHAHDVATVLGEQGVCVRAGHHCVQPLHKKFDLVGSVRASAWWYNEKADIDRLIDGIKKVKTLFA